MPAAVSPSYLLLGLGFACFAAFSWGVKFHFRHTGRVPPGTLLISLLTVTGFCCYARRLLLRLPAIAWPVAAVLFVIALALFGWAVKTTRNAPPTLAFDTDQPAMLYRAGPYRYVRHPFYLSYMLFWAAVAIAAAGPLVCAIAAAMLLVYWNAAGREERKFARSDLAAAYAAYRASVGMFFPRALP